MKSHALFGLKTRCVAVEEREAMEAHGRRWKAVEGGGRRAVEASLTLRDARGGRFEVDAQEGAALADERVGLIIVKEERLIGR